MRLMLRNVCILFLVLFAVVLPSHADDRLGTKEEAQAMVRKIIAFQKKYGRERAISEGNAAKSEFRDKDLYVFGFLADGTNVVHANKKMIGKNLLDLKDPEGVMIIKELIKVGLSQDGKGWISYKWPNAVTQNMEQKASYVERFGDIIYGCGYLQQ